MERNTEKIENARVVKVLRYFPNSGFSILLVATKGGVIKMIGTCADLALFYPDYLGLNSYLLDAEGHWVRKGDPGYDKYGEEFSAERMILKRNMQKFLKDHIDTIGPITADMLLKTFGDDLEDVLDNVPEELLKLRGITPAKLTRIVNSWKEVSANGERELSKYFASFGVGISAPLLSKIGLYFKQKKLDPVHEIGDNPYSLLEIKGVSFTTADYIAIKLGIDPLDQKRMQYLLPYLLKTSAEENGHTYLHFSEIYSADREYIRATKKMQEFTNAGYFNYSEEEFLGAINLVVDQNSSAYYIDDDKIALLYYYNEEKYIRDTIAKRIKSSDHAPVTKEEIDKFILKEEKKISKETGTKVRFDKKQKEAIYSLGESRSNVFVLCGYAGTGKTTIARAILDFLQEYRGKNRIATCALSGMASRRIHALTGYPSSTIHSLLGFNPQTDNFRYNANSQLENDAILVDEASMINLYLFYSLLKASPDNCTLVFVGDDAQLPPIGEGNVFSDLLQKPTIPKVTLEKIYRQKEDSVISEFGSYIRKGLVPPGYLDKHEDFEFIVANDIYKAKEILLKEIEETIKREHLEGLDKILRIQVISPQKTSEAGTNELNKILQKELNEEKKEFIVNEVGDKIKVNDKVIHIKNENMPVVSYKEYNNAVKTKSIRQLKFEEARIFNGSMGIIDNVDFPNRTFYVKYEDVFDEPIIVSYLFDDFKELIDLGYAVTVHKSQGSQFDYVFMPVFNRFYYILNNKLTYTAITRAKKRITIVGEPSAFEKACTSIDKTKRNTFLSEFDILDKRTKKETKMGKRRMKKQKKKEAKNESR